MSEISDTKKENSIKKPFTLIIEGICPSCSIRNCSDHISQKVITDKQTGLEFDVICICKNH